MSRKKSHSGDTPARPAPALGESGLHIAIPSPLFVAWLIALLVARWLLPTEGAAEGLTLWLVQLVLFTALARTAWSWRFGDRPARLDWLDGAMGLLIAAQVISALVVVLTVGNARAAINMAWEWVGSGVLIWLLRQELRSAHVVRELCVGLSLTAAVLAGYGLYQHYFWYPQMVREYQRLTGEVRDLTEPDENGQPQRLSGSDARQLARLQREMAQMGVPTEESSRQLWSPASRSM